MRHRADSLSYLRGGCAGCVASEVAEGFTIAAKLSPSSPADMGIVSQCTCNCGTAPEPKGSPPAHSGMLVGIKGGKLSFLGPGGEHKWLQGPAVPVGAAASTEISYLPNTDLKTGVVTISVNGQSQVRHSYARVSGECWWYNST